jgi:prolycopene isomerase
MKKRCGARRHFPIQTLIISGALSLILAGAPGCGGQEKTDLSFDALTSATPGVASMRLTSSHPFWKRSDCDACHDTAHGRGYRPAECATCHGANGSPSRPLACQGSDCLACHPDAHPGQASSAPNDCRSCHEYDPGQAECTHTGDYDAVVIGSGGGGLAAAVSLAKAGKRTLLIEKNYQIGGMMTSLKRLDYRIEVSLHGLDYMGVNTAESLAGPGAITPVAAGPVMYRVVTPDFTFDVPAGKEEYRARLKAQFPEEADNIDDIFEQAQITGMGSSQTSALELLHQFTQDQKLITILTAISIYLGVPPAELSGSFYAMGMLTGYHDGGFNYPVGGSQAIANALAAAYTAHGGEILLHTLATRVVIENGRATEVRTDEGGCFRADAVIANVNTPDLYQKLIGAEYFDPAFLAEQNARVLGTSIFAVYLGVDYDYQDYMPEGSHEVFVYKSYDMADHYRGVAECDPRKTAFGFANFSMVDPTAAPPGKNAIAVVSQLAPECFGGWGWDSSYQEYNDYKMAMAEEYVRQAEEFLPGLSDHIEVMEVATPRTVIQYTLNPGGTIFGWRSYTKDKAFIQLFNPEGVRTPIPNVFLASAWAFGGGQTPVLLSGVLAAGAVP